MKSKIDLRQALKALEHETGRDEQHDGQRELRDDEGVVHPTRCAAAALALTSGQVRGQPRAACVKMEAISPTKTTAVPRLINFNERAWVET